MSGLAPVPFPARVEDDLYNVTAELRSELCQNPAMDEDVAMRVPPSQPIKRKPGDADDDFARELSSVCRKCYENPSMPSPRARSFSPKSSDLVAFVQKCVKKEHGKLQASIELKLDQIATQLLNGQASLRELLEAHSAIKDGPCATVHDKDVFVEEAEVDHPLPKENLYLRKGSADVVQKLVSDPSAKIIGVGTHLPADALITKATTNQPDVSRQGAKETMIQKRADLLVPTGKETIPSWHDVAFQAAVDSIEPCPLFPLFRYFNLDTGKLPKTRPKNWGAWLVSTHRFEQVVTGIIILNALFVGYESDIEIRRMLRDPRDSQPAWIGIVNVAFDVVFVLELAFRVFSLRLFFITDPEDCNWNLFDMFVVISTLAADLVLPGIRALRILRMLRVIRLIRAIRMSNFMKDLRRLMFAMMASVRPFLWALVFLILVIYTGALFFLQGLCEYMASEQVNESERSMIEKWWGTMPRSMMSLFQAVSGGTEWTDLYEPLDAIGARAYIFVFYLAFINVGVLNVITGIFVDTAMSFHDKDLIVKDQQEDLEGCLLHMMRLYRQVATDTTGQITYEQFLNFMQDPDVQAYLAYHHLDATNAKVIFGLLDQGKTNTMNVRQFALGMVNSKGPASHLDSILLFNEVRRLRKELGFLPKEVTTDPEIDP